VDSGDTAPSSCEQSCGLHDLPAVCRRLQRVCRHNLDPILKTPEYKHCAVAVKRIEDQAWGERYIQEEYSRIKAQMNSAIA
jgi:hypothetical protein